MKHLHDIVPAKAKASEPLFSFLVHPGTTLTEELVRAEYQKYVEQIREMEVRMTRVDGYFTITTTGGGWGGGGTARVNPR